jgi:hypothetical protein
MLGHEAAEFQPDAVVLVDHPAVCERRPDRDIPNLVVKRLGFLRVGRGLAEQETIVETRAPRKPVREVTDVLDTEMAERAFDGSLLRVVDGFDLVEGRDRLHRAVHRGEMQGVRRVIEIVAVVPPALARPAEIARAETSRDLQGARFLGGRDLRPAVEADDHVPASSC